MNIRTEQQITGAVAKALREQAGESQTTFWKSVGLTQSGGSRYEGGQTIPKPIRMLVFIRYVAGLKINPSTPEGAKQILELANIKASELSADKAKIGQTLNVVMKHVKDASKELSTITADDAKGGAE